MVMVSQVEMVAYLVVIHNTSYPVYTGEGPMNKLQIAILSAITLGLVVLWSPVLIIKKVKDGLQNT